MNNPFANLFATNNNGSKTNNSLFPNSGLFNSNPGRQESSSSQFNLFNNNPNSNNPFAQNSSNDNNKKESEGKPSLFGAPGNNAFFFGVNNSNPTNPPNNFSPSDTKDKKEEPTSSGLFSNNNKDNKDEEKEKEKSSNLFENKQGGLFDMFSGNTNNTNDKNKLFINNNEETPFTNKKKEEEKKDEPVINNNLDFNPFVKSNVPEKEVQKKNEKKKFDFGGSSSSLFNNISNNNINNNEIIFNKKEIIVESNEINNNIPNIQEENDEMEIDEDIKQDSASTNSDIINNLWISDNKEIIDDDTDMNKKIDYKELEEKSKNKENNINDINLLILPELSEYYFNKSKAISDYYTFSDSNIRDKFSIEISRKIIEILSNLIKGKNLDENKEAELINITTIYIYFDAFILHRNDVIYLMKLRDELLYKYYIPNETLINFDKKNNLIYNNEYNNINSLIILLKKIYFHLTLLDINKAYQQIGLLNQQYENMLRNKMFGDKTMKFKDIFMNVEKIIKIYNNIYTLKENFNSKQIISSFNMLSLFKEVVEIINEMKFESNNMNENIKKIFTECQNIIGLLTGNIDFLINDYNKNNIHLLIMANIFYRFYQNNFIRGIVDCIKNKKIEINIENDLINKMILKIIQNCDQNQIEIVQELKGDYPFLLRYHMIEILSQNAFLFQVENQEKYLKKEAYQLFENFKDLKIPFKYQLNYLSFYPNHEIFTVDNVNDIDKLDDDSSDELKEKGYRKALDYALIYINSKFNNCDNAEEIKKEIDEIKNEIGTKIMDNYSNDILYKINKLCLIKFNERKIYKYSILSYLENYNLENKDINKLKIRQKRSQLCADNELNFDYPQQFDNVVINFYLNTNYIFNQNSFRNMYENKKSQIAQDYKDIQELINLLLNKKDLLSVDNNVRFIINYAEFLLDVMKYNLNMIEKNNKYDIDIVLSCKKFFADCFPLPKCPTFMWYHVLMAIKNVIDDNIAQFNNTTFIGENDELSEDLSIWDKKLIYEIMKIEKIKENNVINYERAKNMYENAISFINDITQGFYFNQNIY